jgi:hypothetical protein
MAVPWLRQGAFLSRRFPAMVFPETSVERRDGCGEVDCRFSTGILDPIRVSITSIQASITGSDPGLEPVLPVYLQCRKHCTVQGSYVTH